MADHNININIKDTTGAKAAATPGKGGKVMAQLDPVSLQKLNRAFKDAISKSFNLQKLGDTIAKAVSREIPAAKQAGPGATKADINRIVRQVSGDLAKQISQSLVNALSKPTTAAGKPGISDRKIVDSISNLDKNIQSAVKDLNTQLQRQLGKQLGPDVSRNIANAVSSSIEKAVPRSLNKAARDLSGAVSGIQSIVREITAVANSIRKMREGGIDIGEIKPLVTSLKKLGTEFGKLPSEIKQARDSAKAVAKEEKQIYNNISKALTDLRKATRERVTGVKERAAADPQKFAQTIARELSKFAAGAPALKGTKIEQTLVGLDKKIEHVGDITKAISGLEKEVRNQVQSGKLSTESVKAIVGAIDTLNNNLKDLPKAFGGDKGDKLFRRLEKFTERTEKLLSTVKIVLDETEIKKQIESAAKTAKPKIEVEVDLDVGKISRNLKSSLDKVLSDISKKAEELNLVNVKAGLKELGAARAGGATGAARDIILDLKQIPELKEFSAALKEAADSMALTSGLKGVDASAKTLSTKMDKAAGTLDAVRVTYEKMKRNEERRVLGPVRGARAALETYKIRRYPEEVIPPGKLGFKDIEKPGVKFGATAESAVKKNAEELAKSLRGLQDHMVSVLTSELEKGASGWKIVRESSEQAVDEYFKLATGGAIGNIKSAGKQWSIQIADIAKLRKDLGKGFEAVSPAKAVEAFKESLVEHEVVGRAAAVRPQLIAKWVKAASKETIENMETLSSAQKEAFIELKDKFKAPEVAAEMADAVKDVLGGEKEIERVFRKTFAVLEAERKMMEGFIDEMGRQRAPVLKTLAVPAAKLTGTGAAAFETAAGSLRALPKFATFMTGFEKLYDDLLKVGRLPLGETFAPKIRAIGVKPTGAGIVEAEKLSKEMLKAFAGAPEFKGMVTEFYKGAAVPRGLELERAGVKGVGDLATEVENVIDTFKKLPEAERNIDNFIDAMNKVGISAYDVVKSLDEIRFENIYDVLKKVITTPLRGVAKEPHFERSVRRFEEASRQLEQLLPLIEPGRPRRGAHQEAIVQLFTRSSQIYKDLPISMKETKDVIKDLNIRLGELVAETKELRARKGEAFEKRLGELKIPETVRELSTLGIPEALASRITELRPGKAGRGLSQLEDLQAATLKLYTENLRELAPFGAQFQNWARNITSVSNALSSASDDTLDSLKKFGGAVSGVGTEFPTFRTEREREAIAGGRFGRRGYGLNVLAELRTTASTFEDQVLISGKIADALTSITKVLVRPGIAGRLRQFKEEAAAGVGEVDPKLLRDVTKSIGDVSDKIQDVLGVPERYKGRADRALIQEVTKAITVVRGREVEVQAAKLAEVFLNYFGRKITTRFGSKGVALTPTPPKNLRGILQQYGEKPVKILPKAERTRAGLGVAIMPKTMGQLASEIIQESAEELKKKGMTTAQIRELSTGLLNSGNRFMIDMFKQAGVVAEDEIKIEKTVFTKFKNALSKLDEDLASDIEGITGLKKIHKKRVGKPAFEERPIDIRISAYGAGKRGLQTEALESVMANVMGLTPGGRPGTMKAALKPETYKGMLKGKGPLEPGMLSKYSEALGFEKAVPGLKEDVFKQLTEEFKRKGIAEDLAKRMAELETLSNYYVDVVDELSKGIPRKGLVGPKFVEIVEEPHLFEDWTKKEISKGLKGEKLNLPAFAAYSAIFGEQSAFMEELKKSTTVDTKEAFEYIKALQTVNAQSDEFKKLLTKPLKTEDLFNIKDFTEATGTLEDFKDTILDVQKFPGPFKVKIPTAGKGAAGAYEELYVPGAEARGTYEEPLIAGERAPKVVARRLANLLAAAKRVETLRTGFAEVEKQISDLEIQLSRTEDPQEAERINTRLAELFKDLESLYSQPERVSAVKREITTSVGNMLRRVQELSKARTGREEIEEIIEKMLSVMSETAAPPPGFRAKGVTTKFSEKQVFGRMLKGKPGFGEYADAASRMSDLIIGVSEGSREYLRKLEFALREVTAGSTKGPAAAALRREEKYFSSVDIQSEEFVNRLKQAIDRQRQRVSNVTKVEKAAEGGYLATLGKQLGVTTEAADKEFERVISSLARAKIDYYNTLAEEIMGKGGAVEKLLLSRTIPAVMGKAISATVDKTEDLQRFSDDLKNIYGQFSNLDEKFKLGELEDISKEILGIREEHAESVEKLKKAGLPVLKQYELGVPPAFAKKLPIKYKPKYKVKGKELEIISEDMRKEVETTLFDLLKEAEALTKGTFVGKPGAVMKPPGRDELRKYVEKELVPYIESVRYPFTGISSVQPFKPRLMPGARAKHALAVPGMPEMDIGKFDELLEKVRGIRDALENERRKLTDMPEDIEKRKSLSSAIDELNRAISRVIPKYLSHEQKLDFDGDAIEIHTATTKEAREDIKKHFDSLADDIDSTRAVFRDFFTYEARQVPSGKYVLGEMAQAFEKKFPFEKGFEFLGKPYLEREMAAFTPAQQLEALTGRPGAKSAADVLKDITTEFVRGPEEQKKILEAIDSTVDKSASAMIKAIEALAGDSGKLVKEGIKTRSFEEKYKDAIEAQLYKIHTGPETEALYRLTRVVESFAGFGGGQIAPGAESRAVDVFKKRWPRIKALGGQPEFEFQTMINELLRFGIQKGMDVKHAGEFPVAGEVVRDLSKGEMAAEKLFDRITDKNEEAFKDLGEFIEQNEVAIRRRLGRLPTKELRGEARTLREARGMRIGPAETMERPELEKEIIGMVGFKGFLKELAKQIREQAIEGLIKEISSLPPAARQRRTRGAADIRAWATREIKAEAEGRRAPFTPAINIRRHIIAQRQPLYMKRVAGATPEGELKAAQARGAKLPEPDFVFAGMSKADISRYTERYKRAQATALNLARDLKRATEAMGGGAYANMVTSSIQNIYEEQERINKELLSKIGPEGFEKTVPGIPVVERVLTGAGMVDLTKQLLGDPSQISDAFIENMQKQVGRYSDMLGVGMLTAAEKFEIKQQALEDFAKKAEGAFVEKGLSEEEFKSNVDKYAKSWLEKAFALKQMDKIVEALESKRHEALVLRAILPAPEDLKKVTKENIKPFVAEQMKEAALSRTEREKMVSAFAPRARVRGAEREMFAKRAPIERIIPGKAAGDCIPVTNCDKPLDVFIVGASGDVKFNVEGERGLTTAAKKRMLKETINVAKEQEPTLKELSAIRNTLLNIQKETSGFAKQLPPEAFRSLSEAFKASGLAGGGAFGGAGELFGPGVEFKPENLAKSQIKAIMETMLGIIEKTKELEAEQFLGSAIHTKVQKKLKEQFGKGVEFEKFTRYEDETAGTIAGRMDAIFKDTTGKVEKVMDIKTVSADIINQLGEGAITLDEALSKNITAYTRQKLEDVATQLAVYMAGLQQRGLAVEKLVGEAALYSKLEPERPPTIVKIMPAEVKERLEMAMASVAKARELVQKYIVEGAGIEDLPVEFRKLIEDVSRKFERIKGGAPRFARTISPDFFDQIEQASKDLTEDEINKYVNLATQYYKAIKPRTMAAKKVPTREFIEKRERVRQERKIREAMETGVDLGGLEKAFKPATAGDLESVFQNLVALHEQAKAYQDIVEKIDFESTFKGLADPIKEVLRKVMEQGRAGGMGQELANVLKDLEEEGTVGHKEAMQAWKLYRIALGDFFIKQANEARKSIQDAGEDYAEASKAYGQFQAYINRFKETIVGGLGKRTDIYAPRGQFVSPELARGAGVYLERGEIIKRTQGALGEDEQLRNLFKMIVETEKAPVFKARDVVSQLTNVNENLLKMLNNADLVMRKGEDLKSAWDFDPLVKNVIRLRAALKEYLRFNVREDFTSVQRKNIEDVVKLLGQAETAFSRFGGAGAGGPGGAAGGGGRWGQTGITKVLPWLDPEAQRALHMQNVANLREYFKKAQEAGGPQVGERFTYLMKVLDQTGSVVKNTAFDFHKYGEFVNKAGESASAFTEKQRDLITYTQGANRTFRAALRRVTMWGAAATIVYGGVSQLKSAIGTLADIETGVAQLRMVMSPLETNFEGLQMAAVNFAKTYGVAVTDVLKGMRIFAQQGLKQAEVIDRTRTATLASNVTTLNAKDATEAITAASKIFRSEGESTLRFIDAWSEVEAKHAITSADLALALRKAASAGKNAGFTFDELNGVIASIGAVTRQTGREVGTSLRFIFRRLTSEKAPKELAKIGIPVLTETGELRRGFDILSDLSMAWKDLTSAQRMNIAQAVGGVRQYNQVLVLMDNWREAVDATRDSLNSVGSAQRKNQEIMKTYRKQVAQTKAAAVELQMAFGKAYLPIAKLGLKGFKFLLESLAAVPNSLKAVATGIALMVTYIAKGDRIINSFTTSLGQGSQFISEFFDSFRKGLKTAGFEVFGMGKGMEFEGLKTLTEGKSMRDFHSALGKSAYLIAEVGKSWNRMLSDMTIGAGTAATAIGKPIATAGRGIQAISPVGGLGGIMAAPGRAGLTPGTVRETLRTGGAAGLAQVGKASLGVVAGITATVAGKSTEIVGEAIDMFGKGLGAAGQKFLKDFAGQNTGLVKATAPLILSFAALTPVLKSVFNYYGRITKSAQDYERSAYGIRRANESELNTIRGLIKDYDTFSDRLEGARKAAEPTTKARRQELGTYESPLLALANIQKNVTDIANKLADTNINLVVGYDKLGNAVLRTVGNFKEYLKQLEKLKIKEMAGTEIDVLDKYVQDLTQIEGPEKWKSELKKLLKEAPVFGEIIGKHIRISPAKALDEVIQRLNKLISLKNKYPISAAFDKDIKKYQLALKEVRSGFQQTYKDFRRVLSDIATAGLDRDEIAELLGREELRKGFELMIDVEPRFNIKGVKGAIRPEDVLGAEVLRRVFPAIAPVLDVTSVLTEARLETAGARPRVGKALSGDIVTFWKDAANKYNIAGNQAVVSLKETTDGVFEWFVTYFNTKTLKVEERPFSENLQQLVDNIFPLKAAQEDLSDRVEVFNEFVAGAAAGLRGISAKDFKQEFGLGERFFAEIPTTTLLQGRQGFVPGPGGGEFGTSPFQKEWQSTIEEFFFKPMTEYRMKAEQLEKLRLEGLEGERVTLATGLYEELVKLQNVLKNNQVVLQYRAVLVDLTKTMEEGYRSVKENLAVERDRLKLERDVTGYMKGVAQGLDGISLGVQRFSELTARQRALIEEPRFRAGAAALGGAEIRRTGVRENIYAVDRALVAIEGIRAVAKGFGAALGPEELKKYTEVVARTGETGAAEMVLETRKVEKNTSDTVDRLDRMLENMGDQAAIDEMLSSMTDLIGSGLDSDQKTVNAMERVARIREKYANKDNREVVMASNKAIDVLVKNLVEQVGMKKAMDMVENNTTLFAKKFTPEEFAQRAFGGIDYDEFKDRMSKVMTEERRWNWRMLDYQTKPAFSSLEETKKLSELQKQTSDTGLLSSKNLIKLGAATTAFQHFSKTAHSKTIDKLDEQVKQIDMQIKESEKGGKNIEKLTQQKTIYEKAIETEKGKLEFDKMVQAVAALSTGTMALAKSMGLTEGQIKTLGGAAIGLYAAVKLVSSITGREMPESAKEFGKTLKETTKKAIVGEKIGYPDAREVRKSGEKFMKDYGKTIKDGAGQFKEQLKKATTEGVKRAPAEMGVAGSAEELKKEADKIRKEAGRAITNAEGTRRIRQLILAYTVATAAGYTAAKGEDRTRLATLNNLAEEQSEVFADIIRQYPEEAQKVIDQMRTSVQDMKEEAGRAVVETDIKSLVMDTEKERKKVTEDMEKIRESLVAEHERITEEMKKSADKLAKIEIAKQFEMEIEEMNKAIDALEIGSKLREKFEIETAGLLRGARRPGTVDFGIRRITEAAPEELIKARAERERIPGLYYDRSAKRMEQLYVDEEKRRIKLAKLEEYTIERGALGERRGIFGAGLSAAEEARYKMLGAAMGELASDISGLSDSIIAAKNKLRSAIIDAEIELLSRTQEREYRVAGSIEKVIRGLKIGRGLFAGGPAIPPVELDFGPRTFKELNAYQIAVRSFIKEGKGKVGYFENLYRSAKETVGRGMGPGQLLRAIPPRALMRMFEYIPRGISKTFEKGEGLGPLISSIKEALEGEIVYPKALTEYEEALKRQESIINFIRTAREKATEAELSGLEDAEDEVDRWKSAIADAKEELKGINETLAENEEAAREFTMEGEKIGRAVDRLKTAFERIEKINIDAYFSNLQVALSDTLRGFPGEAVLPPTRREMTPQQLMFATGREEFKGLLYSYRANAEMLGVLASAIENTTNLRREEIDMMLDSGSAAISNASAFKNLTKESQTLIERYERMRKSSMDMAEAIRNATGFIGILRDAANRLKEVAVAEIVERMPGVERAREMEARLYGGAHPLAAQAITTRQERDARRYGAELRHLESTRFDIRRSELQKQIFGGGLEGQPLFDAIQDLLDIPDQEKRDIKAFDQSFENRRILRQKEAFQQTIHNLQMYKKTNKLNEAQIGGVDAVINAYDKAVGTMLEPTFKDGIKYFKGVEGAAQEGIETAQQDFIDIFGKAAQDLLGQAPLKEAVADPIVAKLSETNSILLSLADLMGVNRDMLKGLAKSSEMPWEDAALKPKETYLSAEPSWAKKQWQTLSRWRQIQNKFFFGEEEKQRGGTIFGAGGPKEDNVPIWASAGEYVIKADSAKKLGYGFLDKLNQEGKIPAPERFRTGDTVLDYMLYGETPKMQRGGGVPSIYAEPKKSVLEKIGGALWEIIPFHQYATKEGRLLSAAMPAEARSQQNIGEFMKALDLIIGGETEITNIPKKLASASKGIIGPAESLVESLIPKGGFQKGLDNFVSELGKQFTGLPEFKYKVFSLNEFKNVKSAMKDVASVFEQKPYLKGRLKEIDFSKPLDPTVHGKHVWNSKESRVLISSKTAGFPHATEEMLSHISEAVRFRVPFSKGAFDTATYGKAVLHHELLGHFKGTELQTALSYARRLAKQGEDIPKSVLDFSDDFAKTIKTARKAKRGALRFPEETEALVGRKYALKPGETIPVGYEDIARGATEKTPVTRALSKLEKKEALVAQDIAEITSRPGYDKYRRNYRSRLLKTAKAGYEGRVFGKGGPVPRFAEGGGVSAWLATIFGGDEKEPKKSVEDIPLGTGTLKQSVEEIKKRKEKQERMMTELGYKNGGRVFTEHKPLEDLTLGEAQRTLKGSVNFWSDWRESKGLLERYQKRFEAEGGTDKDREAIEQMKKNIESAAGLLNSIRTGKARAIDVDVHKEYSKAKFIMKRYDVMSAIEFQKDLKKKYGKDWLKKVAPNLALTPENIKALLEAMKKAADKTNLTVRELSQPFTDATKKEEIPGGLAGGRMKSDGLTYLHGGEVVIPEKYADGGEIEPLRFDKNVLNNKPSIEIDTEEIADKIEEAIKDAIENAEFPKVEVETNGVSVPVDTEGATVLVDTAGVTVPVDAAEAVASIEAALRTANAGGGGAAVGAERMDRVEELLDKLDSTMFNIKEDLTQNIEMVDSKILDKSVITEMIKTTADPLLTEINRGSSTGDDHRREIDNLRAHLSYRIDTLESQIQRVSTHVGGS